MTHFLIFTSLSNSVSHLPLHVQKLLYWIVKEGEDSNNQSYNFFFYLEIFEEHKYKKVYKTPCLKALLLKLVNFF